MARELPGFYFDEAKNRYFPIKGPIPGSSRKRKSPAASTSVANKSQSSINRSTNKLLHFRELSGNITPSSKGRLNFQTEYLKKMASQPVGSLNENVLLKASFRLQLAFTSYEIWKYDNTHRDVESALEQINILINKPDGPEETEVLVVSGWDGGLCLFQLEKDERILPNTMMKRVPTCAWLPKTEQLSELVKLPCHSCVPLGASVHLPSEISSIDEVTPRKVLVTTLGSGTSPGEVSMLDFSKEVDLDNDPHFPIRNINFITSFESTIWTAASNLDGSKVVVGTNRGASLVDINSGTSSQIFRCKSDVLSAEVDNRQHIILCGLRSGQIVTVDSREKPRELSSRCKLPDFSFFPGVKLPGIMYPSSQISMPSSICSLVSLIERDQYFLASSMNGLIKLYDHRLLKKGPVQTYEGHVNSHSRIQLGVDPTERIVISGGEDCKVRLWSIRTGEMLFEEKFMDSIPSVVCWPRRGVDNEYWHNHRWGVWLGSHEGLAYMNWP